MRSLTVVLGAVLVLCVVPPATGDSGAAILAGTGVRGGLIVHIGCGDGILTTSLRANDTCLVHGLDTDAARVSKAREHIRSAGLYGPVSVDVFDGKHLPYADNLVNLIVASGKWPVASGEIERVLAPRGVVVVSPKAKLASTELSPLATRLPHRSQPTKAGHSPLDDGWLTFQKPVPSAIDDWTHYLHGADNNAVSRDTRVGPPERLQWSAEPTWPRSHEYTPSMPCLVSDGGRIFYLHDDGLRGVFDKRLPERWFVYARDAFNGLLLWRVPLPDWGPDQWKHTRHWHTPLTLSRRLVATGGKVYVTLGYRAPVSVLDAGTGARIRTFEHTADADEILCVGDTLLVRRRETIPNYPSGAEAWNIHVRAEAAKKTPKAWTQLPEVEKQPSSIVAVDVETGQLRWQAECGPVMALSLAATDERVCYHTFEEVVCLRVTDGKELWRGKSVSWPDLTGTSGTLLLHGNAVFHAGTGGVQAWRAATGAELWRGPRIARTTIRHPPDLFIADGLLWGGLTPDMPTGRIPREEAPDAAPAMRGKLVQGLDPATGKVARELEIAALISPGHHVRCYRAKATERYLMWPKRGIEFVDIIDGDDHRRCNWVRGECSYGVMPANGLVYAPPHPCQCNLGVVLTGFNALAPAPRKAPAPAGEPLTRGPAYGTATVKRDATVGLEWPTYRRDGARSGRTRSSVPTPLSRQWARSVGGQLTPPVAAGGRVYVASRNTHTVHALDDTTGASRWLFTAGGPVDSPPTVHRGFVVFGCRDGHVYCLRETDGALVWRFRAGPCERRIVIRGQLESPWGVSGSVLAREGVVYFAAGYSSFLDGGVRLYGLSLTTGEVLHEHHFAGPEPDITKVPGPTYHMEGTRADLLSTDGESIFMLFQGFDMKLNKLPTPPGDGAGNRKIARRLAPRGGFLDTTWFDRTSWTHGERWLGRHFRSGTPASGQIIVFEEDTSYTLQVYSKQFFMSPHFVPGSGYLLRADDYGEPKAHGKPRPPRWSNRVPVRARAMVLAGDALFLAGAPDEVPPKDPYAGFEGRLQPVLWGVSKKDGKKLFGMPLQDEPVFDGMIAASGRLYVSLKDGDLLCLGEDATRKHDYD